MSKRKDRERAESGIIYRDGKLWNKDEWYAAHQTKQMRQVGVDKAVTEQMASKFPKEETLSLPKDVKSYFCSQCQHKHNVGSKIFIAHRQHARTPLELA